MIEVDGREQCSKAPETLVFQGLTGLPTNPAEKNDNAKH